MNFEKKYVVFKKLAEAKSIFSNLQSYGEHHPLIKSVSKVDQNNQDRERYHIREQPFSWIPFHFYYFADKHIHSGKMEYRITGIPFLHPIITYQFESLADHKTKIIFSLQITGLRIFRSILLKKMIAAQDVLMASINEQS